MLEGFALHAQEPRKACRLAAEGDIGEAGSSHEVSDLSFFLIFHHADEELQSRIVIGGIVEALEQLTDRGSDFDAILFMAVNPPHRIGVFV